MSGIEVAGLVLGAFPLLLAALDKWRRVAEVWDDWWKIKREYRKCRQDVACAEIELEVNLKRFLLPLVVVDDDEVAALMADPGGARWCEPHLEKKLRKRLPRSYDLYVETIEEIKDVVDRIEQEICAEALGSSKDERLEPHYLAEKSLGRWSNWKKAMNSSQDHVIRFRRNVGEQAQRAKFAVRREHRDKLFAELSHYNKRLRTLLETNDMDQQLAISRDGAKKSKAADEIFTLWRHAERVYELLSKSFRCRCRNMHRLHLKLSHLRKCSNIEFYFHMIYGMLGSDEPWSRKRLTARKLEGSTPSIPSSDFSLLSLSSSDNVPSKSALSSIKKGKMPAIRLEQSVSDSPSAKTLSNKKVSFKNASPVPLFELENGEPSYPLISDVCDAITNTLPDTECLGMLKDDNIEDAFALLSPKMEEFNLPKTRSLEDLLKRNNTVRLTRQQRYRIALTLASSHVQLFSTPWLTRWQKSRILVTSPASSSDLYIMHSVPAASGPDAYASNSSHTSAATESELLASQTAFATTDSDPLGFRTASDPMAFRIAMLQSLGILLLELCYGEAIEEYEVRKALQLPGASPEIENMLDLAAAQRWAPGVLGEAGERFADAVQWCLSGGSREDEPRRWRKEVWDNVVEPLQWSLEQFGQSSS